MYEQSHWIQSAFVMMIYTWRCVGPSLENQLISGIIMIIRRVEESIIIIIIVKKKGKKKETTEENVLLCCCYCLIIMWMCEREGQ